MPLNPSDPRTHITPESFGVAPELLGMPLATPWRRAAAMLCDLIPLAILIGAHSLVLAVAAAAMLWRASIPSTKTGVIRRGVRGALRLGAAGLAFIVVFRIGGAVFDREEESDPDDVASDIEVPDVDFDGADAGLLDLPGLAGIPDISQLARAEDTTEARERAARVAEWIRTVDAPAKARREIAEGLLSSIPGDEERAVAREVFASAFDDSASGLEASGPAADSSVLAYAQAIANADTATQRALRPHVARIVAAAEIASLEARIVDLEDDVDDLEEERDELRRELEQEEGGGITGLLGSLAEDLGIGFGWGALYFTSFLALWRGQTPGKWLLGIRVIRLDGQPMGFWRAFERFGGYAASLSTGLLGFFQILWDRNRQGLHDKAADTVVVRVQRRPAPPPTPATGFASPRARR